MAWDKLNRTSKRDAPPSKDTPRNQLSCGRAWTNVDPGIHRALVKFIIILILAVPIQLGTEMNLTLLGVTRGVQKKQQVHLQRPRNVPVTKIAKISAFKRLAVDAAVSLTLRLARIIAFMVRSMWGVMIYQNRKKLDQPGPILSNGNGSSILEVLAMIIYIYIYYTVKSCKIPIDPLMTINNQ